MLFDTSYPLSLSLQDSISSEISDLYWLVDYYLVLILIFITYLIFIIIMKYVNTYTNDLNTTHSNKIEIVWTILPCVILILISLPTFTLLYLIDEVLDPNITIKCIGKQWFWTYENNMNSIDSYILPNGMNRLLSTDNSIIVPIDHEIRLLTSSTDVIHSFSIPSLGIKSDCIPGRLNQLSLFINRYGIFNGMCSELCGPQHSFMPIQLISTDLNTYLNLS